MNKKVFILGLVALLAISGIIASNMGFKLNYRMNAVTPAVSLSGTNTLGLPYNRQFGIDTALALINDLGGTVNVSSVANFVEATDGFDVYTGIKGSPSPDFPLGGGAAVFVKMAVGVDYIIVGSHQPSMGISMDAPSVGVSASGTNFYAPPYHTSVGTALGLIGDLGGTVNVASVSNFVEATDGFDVYTGIKGSPSPDFPLVPGKGYFVKMINTVNYVPSHY